MTEVVELDEITRFKECGKNDDEDELQWAAMEKPQKEIQYTTLDLLHDRTENSVDGSKESEEIRKKVKIQHPTTLKSAQERHAFINKLLKKIKEDNRNLLLKQRERIQRHLFINAGRSRLLKRKRPQHLHYCWHMSIYNYAILTDFMIVFSVEWV